MKSTNHKHIVDRILVDSEILIEVRECSFLRQTFLAYCDCPEDTTIENKLKLESRDRNRIINHDGGILEVIFLYIF